MQRVPTGSAARPEKQESEEECDHCAGSSANSPYHRGPAVQGWDRPVRVMQFEAKGYPSPASVGLDLSSNNPGS